MLARVRLFAIARERAGRPLIEVELADGATIADLKAKLAELVPALASILPMTRFSVNAHYADDATLIPLDADLAAIPPVSGGMISGTSR